MKLIPLHLDSLAHNPSQGLYQNGMFPGKYNLNPGPRNKKPVSVKTIAEKNMIVNKASNISRVDAFRHRITRIGSATSKAMIAAGSSP